MPKTQIQVDESTADALHNRKRRGESYDDVISRLVDHDNHMALVDVYDGDELVGRNHMTAGDSITMADDAGGYQVILQNVDHDPYLIEEETSDE